MRKKLIFSALALFSLSAMITSCSKYEEGSKFTVLTKKQRMTGSWSLVKTEYNGQTETADKDAFILTLDKDGTATAKYTSTITIGGSTTTSTSEDKGTWEFSGDKEELRLIDTDGNVDNYTIVKLKNKELTLRDEGDTDDEDYLLYFEQ